LLAKKNINKKSSFANLLTKKKQQDELNNNINELKKIIINSFTNIQTLVEIQSNLVDELRDIYLYK
jgi:hypothetical protein